jgi:hypothetical protein
MHRILISFLVVLFAFNVQAQDKPIISKNTLFEAMTNFPNSSAVRTFVDTEFSNLSQSRKKVITMFNKLFEYKALTSEDIEKVHQKAIEIIVAGDEQMVNLYIKNNPINLIESKDER